MIGGSRDSSKIERFCETELHVYTLPTKLYRLKNGTGYYWLTGNIYQSGKKSHWNFSRQDQRLSHINTSTENMLLAQRELAMGLKK